VILEHIRGLIVIRQRRLDIDQLPRRIIGFGIEDRPHGIVRLAQVIIPVADLADVDFDADTEVRPALADGVAQPVEGEIAGLLAITDPIKKSTPWAIRALREDGVEVIMATGDERQTAQAVAEKYKVAISGQVEHERPLLTVPRCRKAPVIDGKLDPGEWDEAAGAAGFVEIAGGSLSSVGTRVYLTYDEKNLYLAFRCPVEGKPVGHKYELNQGTPWDEDAVEIYLQPEVGFTGKFSAFQEQKGTPWDCTSLFKLLLKIARFPG
jgi:hypothetical protein